MQSRRLFDLPIQHDCAKTEVVEWTPRELFTTSPPVLVIKEGYLPASFRLHPDNTDEQIQEPKSWFASVIGLKGDTASPISFGLACFPLHKYKFAYQLLISSACSSIPHWMERRGFKTIVCSGFLSMFIPTARML